MLGPNITDRQIIMNHFADLVVENFYLNTIFIHNEIKVQLTYTSTDIHITIANGHVILECTGTDGFTRERVEEVKSVSLGDPKLEEKFVKIFARALKILYEKEKNDLELRLMNVSTLLDGIDVSKESALQNIQNSS